MANMENKSICKQTMQDRCPKKSLHRLPGRIYSIWQVFSDSPAQLKVHRLLSQSSHPQQTWRGGRTWTLTLRSLDIAALLPRQYQAAASFIHDDLQVTWLCCKIGGETSSFFLLQMPLSVLNRVAILR